MSICASSPEEILFGAGGGKAGSKAQKEFSNILSNLTLTDIIKSCNFRFCGTKVAEQVANYLLNEAYDFSHLATEGYDWVYDNNSTQYKEINTILNHLGKTIDDFKIRQSEKNVQSDKPRNVSHQIVPGNIPSKYHSLNYLQNKTVLSYKIMLILFYFHLRDIF